MDDTYGALKGIYNLLVLPPQWVTAGQPDEDELRTVAGCGIEVVINLGLSKSEYSLPDEEGLVKSLGMSYEHIPVQWQAPTAENLSEFFQVIDANKEKKLFLHCAANKRVSIFVALYRVNRLAFPLEVAWQDVVRIWQPDEIWSSFFNMQCKVNTFEI